MFLATASPTPADIATWLGCLAFAVVLVNGIMKIVDRLRGKSTEIAPQPLVVTEQTKFVARKDFETLVRENNEAHDKIFHKVGGVERGASANMEKLRSDMHAMELRLNESGEDRSGKIHERVNEVLGAVSELKGEIKTLQK